MLPKIVMRAFYEGAKARAWGNSGAVEPNAIEQRRLYEGLRRAMHHFALLKWVGSPSDGMPLSRDPYRPLSERQQAVAFDLAVYVFYEVVRRPPPYPAAVMHAPPLVAHVIRDLVEKLLQCGAIVLMRPAAHGTSLPPGATRGYPKGGEVRPPRLALLPH